MAGLVNTTAGAVLKLVRMSISTTQTTAGLNVFFLVKRSTQNTGAATSATIVPLDSTNLASVSGWVISYTANPSPTGTLVGNIAIKNVLTDQSTTVVSPADVVLYDDQYEGQPCTLRLNEGLYLNFNGAALPAGLSVCANFLFTRV
jgi:hypothetical protein